MAERSTATSPPQHSANTQDTTDTTEPAKPAEGTGEALVGAADGTPDDDATAPETPPPAPRPPELHSGNKLAKRYRLEECITRLDGFSSWRAVDEKLRRAVGVHVLPATHDRAPAVLSAARSSALLGDPRFVQVLDAVEENGLVHVIHEWLPGAVPLSTLLHAGPLDAHEAYALASQVSQAMAAAHRQDLPHLRLTPATVLRTGPSQFRIRGLAVDAALRGITATDPKRADTEAIGALLYAALTQRWPYPEGAYGLDGVAGLGKAARDSLAAPEQVRAGVHRGLSDLAMRALVNNGATAASQKPPCTTPEHLARELARLPRIPPADPTPSQLPGLQRTTYQQGSHAPRPRPAAAPRVPDTPPTLPGRTGTALKWGVSALLIAALGLGSWQLADALMRGDTPATEQPGPTAPPAEQNERNDGADLRPVTISAATDFDPEGSGGGENPEEVPNAIDADPESSWPTKNYFGPAFGNLKPGVGLVLDLGEPRQIRELTVTTIGETPVEFRAAGSGVTTMPTELDDYAVIDHGSGESTTLRSQEAIETQFVLVWLTDLPLGDDGNYRGRITNITVSG